MIFSYFSRGIYMKQSLSIICLLAVALVGSTVLDGQSHGGDIPPRKVNVCHLKKNGQYVSINVSLAALAAHLDHGDMLPGTDGGCQPVGSMIRN
jgi:hypothetical protein